jgi:SNF2 family DNA or RNA helicase
VSYTLHDHQIKAVEHLAANPRAGLFLPVGAGKTLSVLHSLTSEHLPALVIAPKRVAEHVWAQEVAKWRPELSVARAIGTPRQRQAAIAQLADVTVMTRDNLGDTDSAAFRQRYRTVILDESQSFKNRQSARWRLARKLTKNAAYVWALTGTPAGNGLLDLWAQVYLIDNGERLYPQITRYRQRYFYPEKVLPNGVVAKYAIKPGAEEAIYSAISDVCLHIPLDGLDLPDLVVNEVPVSLPPDAQRMYEQMKDDAVIDLSLLGSEYLAAPSAAAISNKLVQITSGYVYNDGASGGYVTLHENKLEALCEIIEQTDSNVLVFYKYKSEAEQILRAIPQATSINATGAVERWNAGQIPVLLAHPASAGAGLNLQHGGSCVVWTSLTWSAEEWTQANGRLHRQGQTDTVMCHVLTVPDSIDTHIRKVVDGKLDVQQALLDALT